MIGLKSLHAVNHVISFCLKYSNSAELIALISIVLDSTTMYLSLLESLRWNFLPSLWIFFATVLVSHVASIEFSETSITIEIFIFFFSSTLFNNKALVQGLHFLYFKFWSMQESKHPMPIMLNLNWPRDKLLEFKEGF